MQRLLDEASKISGIKYDISSFADITEAINVMQESMGIAGTTAKEAEKTISGSVNSMKSAWKNLLTGIADDNQDFDKLISNFVDSAATVAENLLPRIEIAILGVGELITKSFPVIIEKIPSIINNVLPKLINSGIEIINMMLQGMLQNLPTIVTGALQIIMALANAIISMLPKILEIGMQVLIQLALGIAQALPTLIPTIVNVVLSMVDMFYQNAPMLIDAAIQLMIGLAIGLIQSIPVLLDKLPMIINSLIKAILNNIPLFVSAGIQLLVALVQNTPAIIWGVLKAIPGIIGAIIGAFGQAIPQMANAGLNLIKGLWQGIQDAGSWIMGKISGFCSGIVDGIKGFFGIKSPSSIMRDEVGKFLAEGVTVGFEKYDPMSDIKKSLSTGINSIQTSLNLEMASNAQLTAQNSGAVSAPTLNFYDTQTTPDAIYRRFNKTMTYGLAGGV